MHELSIARDITGIITRALGRPRRLDRVNVTIGPLSGISPESLRFCFTEVARSQGLGEPELCISETSASLVCLDCCREYSTDDFYDGCPDCGSMMRRIVTGREFTVDSVELDDEGDGRDEC
jgi:hydrogenase nickel incorporation protein HypA/HybF